MASLVVMVNGQEQKRFELDKERMVAGREAGCELHIEHGSISRKHCAISRHGEAYQVQDLGSANGTYVNGRKITAYFMNDGDEILIGQIVLRFQNQVQQPAEDGAVHTMLVDGAVMREQIAKMRAAHAAPAIPGYVPGGGVAPGAPAPSVGPFHPAPAPAPVTAPMQPSPVAHAPAPAAPPAPAMAEAKVAPAPAPAPAPMPMPRPEPVIIDATPTPPPGSLPKVEAAAPPADARPSPTAALFEKQAPKEDSKPALAPTPMPPAPPAPPAPPFMAPPPAPMPAPAAKVADMDKTPMPGSLPAVATPPAPPAPPPMAPPPAPMPMPPAPPPAPAPDPAYAHTMMPPAPLNLAPMPMPPPAPIPMPMPAASAPPAPPAQSKYASSPPPYPMPAPNKSSGPGDPGGLPPAPHTTNPALAAAMQSSSAPSAAPHMPPTTPSGKAIQPHEIPTMQGPAPQRYAAPPPANPAYAPTPAPAPAYPPQPGYPQQPGYPPPQGVYPQQPQGGYPPPQQQGYPPQQQGGWPQPPAMQPAVGAPPQGQTNYPPPQQQPQGGGMPPMPNTALPPVGQFFGAAGSAENGASWPLAEFVPRILATIVDGVILCVPLFAISMILGLVLAPLLVGILGLIGALLIWVINLVVTLGLFFGYFYFLESGPKRATFGKVLFNLAITDVSGNPVEKKVVFKRALVRLIPFEWVLAFLNPQRQALHDQWCNTLVKQKPKK